MNTAITASAISGILPVLAALAPAQRKIFPAVTWENYEELLNQLSHRSGLRTAFTEGTLAVLAPLYRHEADKDMLTALVRILAKAYGLRAQAAGSTPLKRKQLQRGAEPDSCFYLSPATQVIGQVIGKERLVLGIDPPPDLVIEVDVTHPAHSKIETYARFQVPEFWRYDGQTLEIYQRAENQYLPTPQSPAFPGLQASTLTAFLEQSKTAGQDLALEAFETWVKAHVN